MAASGTIKLTYEDVGTGAARDLHGVDCLDRPELRFESGHEVADDLKKNSPRGSTATGLRRTR
jgi:hypothetical protein